MVDISNGPIALRAHANNKYVRARIDQTKSPLQAVDTKIQLWGLFSWLPQNSGTIALQSAANHNYISAHTDQTNSVDVNPGVVDDHSFEVPDISGVKFHDMVTVSPGGTGTIAHIIKSMGGPSNSSQSVADLVSCL